MAMAVLVVTSFYLLKELGQQAAPSSTSKIKEINSEQYFQDKQAAKKAKLEIKDQPMDRPDLFAQIQRERRTPVDRAYPEYAANHLLDEFRAAQVQRSKSAARSAASLTFDERGPGNVAGRTRAVIVDPDDASHNTWFAGSASGGIWKTTNAGQSWTSLTNDLPNLGTNALAMSPANTSVIYAGTGEPFSGGEVDGSGLFKSTDKGVSWTQIGNPATFPNFRNVTRVIVDPNNANVVLATAQSTVFAGGRTSSIFKSTDGGASWTETTTVSGSLEDLVYDPSNFSTMYAGWFGNGVLKSTDGGDTWTNSSSGLKLGQRIELAVSPVDPQRIWASVVGGESGSNSDLYISLDGASNWILLENEDESTLDFLGSPTTGNQGNYDNTVLPHPFDADVVYVGGIDIWKFTLGSGSSERNSIEVVENGTDAFIDFVNFGATFFGGRLETGEAEPLVSVEIRFGQGTQMAHRFTVDMQGSGVPDNDYLFQDYVEVPFQVWDVTNDRQLMASFRDQQENGTWELIENNTDGDGADDSREYLFVHLIDYSTEANPQISSNGGQTHEQLYFVWPTLADGASFDPNDLPVTSLNIELTNITTRVRAFENITDAYEDFDLENTFTNEQFENQLGVHPDQHGLVAIVEDASEQTFRILNTNDGGLYVSAVSANPGAANNSFTYAGVGYNTTQFYGADKAPGENRYIGGMQDNSSWFTPAGTSASASSNYSFAVGGDGFEAIWNNRDANLMMASVQFNQLVRSTNGGSSWSLATSGLSDSGQGQGPFVSRLANSKFKPDRVFTVGRTGVWRSLNFGASWEATPINSEFWQFSNIMDVEVSDVDVDLIWAGSALQADSRLFYSEDGGETFTPTENYNGTALGLTSGFKPHPTERNTVFALFSFADRPKVLKSTDLGANWADISGFEGGSGTSSNGFPDVAVNTILVFPNDGNRIWVGTEIGLVESTNGGASWSLLDCNLPAVSVHDMKIQDDQIVVATYGRGIWSVTIPAIERDVIFAPVLGEVSISPQGETQVEVIFSEIFDSTHVVVNEEVILELAANTTGTVTNSLSDLNLDGNLDVQVISYLSGREFKSDKIERLFFTPNSPSNTYESDFTVDDGSFLGSGFRITRPGGFRSQAIHSDHPYPELTSSVFVLKTPIIVASEEATMTYEDVAIVETGESGTEFGDFEFWDFVIVEGSQDGRTWLPLADGYDASFDPTWQAAYDGSQDGTEDMYVEHTLDLLETFDAGDEILIRFRLFSDPNAVGWGWMIDNVKIQEVVLNSPKKLTNSFQVFPNPINSNSVISYDLANAKNIQFSVIALDGRVIETFSPTRENQGTISLPQLHVNPGIYVLKMDSDLGFETRQILVTD